MSKNKIVAAGAILVVLIIIASFSAMSIVQASTVKNVEKAEITDTLENGASLKWKKVSSADGYRVYQSPSGENAFEKIAQIEDGNAEEYTVEGLEQATAYDFYVTAYKNNSKKNVESEEYTVLSLCTKPSKQTLSAVSSDDEGVLSFAWEINSLAAGYQAQYVKGDAAAFDAKDNGAQEVNIDDKATADYKVEGLDVKETYSVRIRTYITYNDETIYGEWSDVQSVEIAEKVQMASNLDPNKPMIALTFDDGPGYNDASERILDVLEQYGVRATFFMVGKNAKDQPDNLKRKVELGCELGNHTWDHNHYGSAVSASDIKQCSDAIYEATGQYPTCFRSPGGNTTQTIRDECKAEGMPLYYWSLDTQDWKYRDATSVYNKVMNNVSDGDIILMHEIYSTTADAVEKMVPELIKQGYQLVTCQELMLAKSGNAPEAGTQYVNATTVNNKTS